MSCNGCRVLRKGCSDNCVLRQSLQWIETAEAQGHATVFVAKFFGRAGLMSFISAVPDYQRPALFESLLYEAAGRTVNPVNGAVGLLWTGNWNLCQAAVETVFRGGTLRPIPEFLAGSSMPRPQGDEEEAEITCAGNFEIGDSVSKASKRRRQREPSNGLTGKVVTTSPEKQRRGTPSMNSEDSETTTVFESGFGDQNEGPKLLNLFN